MVGIIETISLARIAQIPKTVNLGLNHFLPCYLLSLELVKVDVASIMEVRFIEFADSKGLLELAPEIICFILKLFMGCDSKLL